MLELNRLYHMDCMEGLKQLGNDSVDITLTSPPFKDEDIISDKDYWEFYSCFMGEAARVTKNVLCIIQSATRLTDIVNKFPPKRTMVWYKGVMVCAYRYNPIFCYQMRPDYKINKYIWADVIGCYSIKQKDKIHKDQDPVYVYETVLKMFHDCKTVLDPFMGSGTTAEAAKNQGRDFIGFEANYENFKTANIRIGANENIVR
ncbi:MAG: DNA methyltransferase [Caulobacteraceae bacterium]